MTSFFLLFFLITVQSGRNIRHLPCIVRKSGRSGVCMFAIDCIKQNGTHLGTCIDRFYFGSCCDIKVSINYNLNFQENFQKFTFKKIYQKKKS